jgi:hypothetical protein
MIVRILGNGQVDVPDAASDELNVIDERLSAAVEAGDETGFRAALADLLTRVRALGSPLPADRLVPSDFVLPSPDADLAEVRGLLGADGLVPG